MPLDWDADTYARVGAGVHALGHEVLERTELRGDETVLDAGCGSGRITRLLLERLPRGRVIGVDASLSMIDHARETLGDRVELLLRHVELSVQADRFELGLAQSQILLVVVDDAHRFLDRFLEL